MNTGPGVLFCFKSVGILIEKKDKNHKSRPLQGDPIMLRLTSIFNPQIVGLLDFPLKNKDVSQLWLFPLENDQSIQVLKHK